jgi:hypothetical protein
VIGLNATVAFFDLKNEGFLLLVGCEPIVALRAGTTTTHRATFVRKAAFEYSRIFMSTARAAQNELQ